MVHWNQVRQKELSRDIFFSEELRCEEENDRNNGKKDCAEATSNTFWVGNPYDELARGYVAFTINDAYR